MLVIGLAVAAVLIGAMVWPAISAPRQQIDVFPGPHALANALAEARPGDSIELHAGTYRDSVTITTPQIALEPAGDGPVTIDGGCAEVQTIAVRADGVTLEGLITVRGGRFYDVTYDGVRSGILTGFDLLDSCHGSFGVFAQASGAVVIASNTVTAFAGGGIELFNITDTGAGRLLISSNRVAGAGYGVSVQQSDGGAIDVEQNLLSGNRFAGVQVLASHGVTVRDNTTKDDGSYGVELDALSTHDVVARNVALGNEFDLANLGSGNCFRQNRFRTSEGQISC
jgi:nitrous oxidase accessory protein NosD